MPDQPLSSVRVLDLSTIIAGPLTASLLGDFGADVIKIEQPGYGDPARHYPPLIRDLSAAWAMHGRNKKSVTLDLRHDEAPNLVGRLAEKADVVVTNFRPATLKRFRIDFEDLVKHKSDLVMVHISAFGRSGPYAHRPGFARVAEGYAGLTYRTGDSDGPPMFAGYPVADGVTGIYAAFAALLALRQRDLTGEPQLADIPLYEPLLRMMEDFVTDYGVTGASVERQGNKNPHISPNSMYQTRDSEWIALPASTERMWERLVDVMEEPELKDYGSLSSRLEHRDEVEARVADFVRAHDSEELLEKLSKARVAAGPINSAEQVCNDPHIRARGSIVEVDDGVGGTRLVQAPAGRFSGFSSTLGGPPPMLGENTDAVFEELGGLDTDDIADLRSRNVI
ncbi:CaiB/BaiF CoA transferase family protein [Brevibacterium sp. FAM 25378]|uniref:CaiB/BaiF CoA transferase family protein n=1 Tax=unclassified Brevibacterium TaxID=2614124 RepID=UPI00143DB4D5|nr:CoA transferase [Brevibacterium sp. S22]